MSIMSEFAASLAPAPYDRTTVSERRSSMAAALGASTLDAGYWLESGSWTHGTSIKGHSDVDFMAWASGTRPQRPSTALATLKRDLSNSHWAITDLRVSSPTVKVKFMSSPDFEVVPAWFKNTVGGDNIFWIPGPGDEWTESAPAAHLNFVNEQNDRLGKKVKPLARLVKQWKITHGAPVSSFYLEMRTAEYARGESTIVYDVDLRRIISRLIEYQVRSMNDPTGRVTRIKAASSVENRLRTLTLLREAEVKLMEAYTLHDDSAQAYRYRSLMSDVLGPSFPFPTS